MNARKKMVEHVLESHGNSFTALLSLDKRQNGLTDSQKQMMQLWYEGKKDQEIAKVQGGGSLSTIRQHRFKLREKAKQAKIFHVLMEMLEENTKDSADKFMEVHKEATMVDERWIVTEDEKEKILSTYVMDSGRVKQFPSKEKRKIVILNYILSAFKKGENYTEKEMNEIIKQYFDDFVTIRRYFIEYGFMDRNRDGSAYWLK